MNVCRRSMHLAAVALLLCFVSPPLGAQDAPGPYPELDGHRFSPTRTVGDPWIRTHVVSYLGLGQATDLLQPPIVIDGDTIPGLEGELLYATIDFEYQQRIVDWFAFRVGYAVDARLGTELGTLLARGVNTITGFEIGWLARVLESERDMLSLDFEVSNKSVTQVDIAGFVEDVIEGVEADIVRKSNTLRFSGGGRYAHAFSPLFGIIAVANLGVGESVRRDEDDEVFTQLGAQLDFDLASWRNIPLNVALGYLYDSYPEASQDVDGSISTGYLRVGYVARNDFTIGLQFSGSSVPLQGDDNRAKFGIVEFDLRYYF
ncbi:MAG: hypothetical protein M8860_12005 [marine benthic group bacterium]|nr:hypothetical protein [Gemmatimonadota bacterium]MCL7963557.1 hypothetical protein [Candidatus Carthagonibacter metallireducens]MCL7958083.1 hypothetical protein [Gemmatimonadota bacterium]MCL7966316.1 hypothetical protein [Gemmatimonadota bacterium]MCL7968960.1 hypothetical protein [Gemmatimonadota bacterium]